jgi:hypothetical protein
MQTSSQSSRQESIVKLASQINELMLNHPDRTEAIDAYDMARVLFRKPNSRRPILAIPCESELAHTV